MANDINSVLLIGRLVRDPESKQLSSGTTLANFSLASGRSYTFNGEKREETVFVDCTAWGKLGEIIVKYCVKGKQIAVRGRLKQETWQGPDGKNRSKISVVVEDMQLLSSASGMDRNSVQGGSATNYQSTQAPVENTGFQNGTVTQNEVSGSPQSSNALDTAPASGGFPEEDVPF